VSDYKYIVVEGPIGVGKTTLARRLADSFAAELLLEEPQDNPFLSRFYENPRAHALSTQLYFLLQRARQVHGLRQADMFSRVRVADYLMDKDRLFAELTLEPDELTLYQQVYAHVAGESLQPDSYRQPRYRLRAGYRRALSAATRECLHALLLSLRSVAPGDRQRGQHRLRE
jgi:deoxyadenosine/deoxycytidine kinase